MRNFDETMNREFQKRILKHFFLLELQYSAGSALRITDADIDIFQDGNRFYARDFRFDNLSGSGSLSVDNMDIDIDDTDQLLSQILNAQDVRNKPAILHVGVVASQDVYAGSATRANTKISAVDGAAFVDFSSADILTNHVTHRGKLTITDSAGKKITGYVKAAGTGETYGSNVLTNGDMETGDPPTGWGGARLTPERSTDKRSGTYALKETVNTGVDGYYTNYASVTDKALYKVGVWVKNITSTRVTLMMNSVGFVGHKYIGDTTAIIYTEITAHWTAQGTPLFVGYVVGAVGTSAVLDDAYRTQILTPSATGVTITSTPDGTTYNWASKEADFNYNDASGYTWEIVNEGVLPLPIDPSYRLQTIITEELMRFIIGGWELREDNIARVNLTNELVLWNKKCLRTQSASCLWVFKGLECAYTGSETWCDQSYERCLALGNQVNHIGSRFLPSLMKTELWWGRTPNYRE
jgi:hypothetical protein